MHRKMYIMEKKIISSVVVALLAITSYGQKISGTWNGRLNAGQQKLSLVFKFIQDGSGKGVCTMDCLEQGVKDFPAVVNYISTDSVNISVTKIGASYAGGLKNGEIIGKFSQSGMTFDLNMTSGEVIFIRTQNPQPPSEQIHRMCELNGLSRNIADAQITQFTKTTNPWLKYFLSFDPASDIKGTKCPTMAINGTKDMQVISTSNLASIKQLLPANSKNMVKEYDGLNHLFQHCATGNSSEYVNISETISPEVLKDIADWIKQINLK